MRGFRVASLLSMLGAGGHAAVAQVPRYAIPPLNGAAFVEEVKSEIISQSGTAERHRAVTRSATFSFIVRGDSLIATADTAHLTESVDGIRETIDVGAMIGARWRLLLDPAGKANVLEQPVIPRSIADVSDAATAMDDFFPVIPPQIGVGGSATDAAGRKWRRSTDSAGLERYHWSGTSRGEKRTTGEGVSVTSDETASENTDLVWNRARGPVSWSRHIVTTMTSQFAGRTVRAQVDQRIMVKRTV